MPNDTAGVAPQPGPFTAAGLRIVMHEVLKQPQTMPGRSDLEQLATDLNLTNQAFQMAKNASTDNLRGERVSDAIGTLFMFFEKRKHEAPKYSNDIEEAESFLYGKFLEFVQAMHSHKWELDMDATALMSRLDGWRRLAPTIASAFRSVMVRANPNQSLGLSNDGPVPRFVAAVVPTITGEIPSVINVGKCLKDDARSRRQRP